jgi:hypothetical protein
VKSPLTIHRNAHIEGVRTYKFGLNYHFDAWAVTKY